MNMQRIISLTVLYLMTWQLVGQHSPARVVVDRLYAASLENETDEATTRRVTIYLPPGYDDNATRRYPVIYYLHGFTWSDSLNLVESRYDTLFAHAIQTGKIPPAIIVNADHHTRFRGSYYTNSPLTGNWADFVTRDVVEHLDSNYRTIADAVGRGLTGHSMGGYGALVLGMQHPDVFSVVYAMSPAPLALDHELAAGSDWYRRVDQLPDRETLIKDWDEFGANVVVVLGQAFSPNPARPPFYADRPFHYVEDSLVVDDEVLAIWNDHMPLEMAGRYRANLQRLTALKLDWGRNDEFGLVSTSRKFSQHLEDLGIPHYAEEYIGTHSDRLNTPDGRLLNDVLPFFARYLEFGSTGEETSLR